MSTDLIRGVILAEVERARLAWNAVGGNTPLEVDFENQNAVVLPTETAPYLMVDVVFRGGAQLDLGRNPMQRFDGQIMLAVGVKDGGGTRAASKVLDFVYPYLQLRCNLVGGVQTGEMRPGAPRAVNGFYYVTGTIYFWRDAQAPATP